MTWAAIGLPPARWLRWLRHGPGLLLAGAAVGLAIWGAGRAAEGLWSPLGRATLWVSYQLLRPLVTRPGLPARGVRAGHADIRGHHRPRVLGL